MSLAVKLGDRRSLISICRNLGNVPALDGAAEAAPFQNGELYAALKRRSSTVASGISFMHKFWLCTSFGHAA